MLDDDVETVIDAAYELASGEAGLLDLPPLIARAMPYEWVLMGTRRGLLPLELATNMPDDVVASYAGHYYRIDPWTPRQFGQPGFGRVVHVSWEEVGPRFEHTEFYQDFARTLGTIEPLAVKHHIGDGIELQLAVNGRRANGEPGLDEKERLGAIGRHLVRAIQLRRRLSMAAGEQRITTNVLDRVGFGVAVVDAELRVSLVNRAAERLLGTALTIRGKRLVATAPADDATLRRLVADVVNGGTGGALQLAGDPGLLIRLSRLPPRLMRGAARTYALIAFADPKRSPGDDTAMLRALFGLSPAEADVAIGIVGGETLERLALRRGVRLSTVKTQLENIFAKTGTQSQRDLVRLIGRIPAVE